MPELCCSIYADVIYAGDIRFGKKRCCRDRLFDNFGEAGYFISGEYRW